MVLDDDQCVVTSRHNVETVNMKGYTGQNLRKSKANKPLSIRLLKL